MEYYTYPVSYPELRRMVPRQSHSSIEKARQQSHGKLTICNVTRIKTSVAELTEFTQLQGAVSEPGSMTEVHTVQERAVQALDWGSACGSDGSETVRDQYGGAEVLPSIRY